MATSLLGACTKSIEAVHRDACGRRDGGHLVFDRDGGGYPKLVLRALIAWQGFADRLPTQFGVSLYRVRYWTPGIDGNLVVASGLIAFPRALISNSLYDWSPRAPIRLYFGSLDVDVSPREAELEAARLKERGADIATVDVGPFDHEGSVLQSALMLLVWFDELGRSPQS